MRLSASTRRWLARITAPRKRKPARKRPAPRTALQRGIREEMEHAGAVAWLKRHPKASTRQAAERIAREHLAKNPHAYGGKRRHSPVERLSYAKPWDPDARGGRGGWKPFIRAAMGKSGVYVIKHADGSYVGSSNSGRLYRTMIRHLEEWNRDKDFWVTENRTHGAPGETFDRDKVEVAVLVCPAKQAVALEADLMRRIRGVSNEQSPPGEEVPF